MEPSLSGGQTATVIEITAELVRDLIRGQFPQWSELPVVAVPRQGWDNRTFRLGDQLSVRLPSAEGYVAGVEKEDRWLPLVARHLPLPVPTPVATGKPANGYPFPWSVRRWLPGDTVDNAVDLDRARLARDLGGFLIALRAAPAQDGPAAGRHSFYRGCSPGAYSDEVESALGRLAGVVDVAACRAVWSSALASAWQSPPTWFHGDVAVGNLLTSAGRLSAVIDFGTCGVGDPACDLVMAWTYFTGTERMIFRDAVDLPDDAWRRARGWALWKSLITMPLQSGPGSTSPENQILTQILEDPVSK
jgi:aminoglycoside phosphotransferase (APT) family kinase protein